MDATTRSPMRMVFTDFTISRGNFYGCEFLWTRRLPFFGNKRFEEDYDTYCADLRSSPCHEEGEQVLSLLQGLIDQLESD